MKNLTIRILISAASTIYILGIANLLPGELAHKIIMLLSIAQIVAAVLSFGGRQRILNVYSSSIWHGSDLDRRCLRELTSYVFLGGSVSTILLAGAILTSQSQTIFLVILLGLAISSSELIFHYYLSAGKVTGFPVFYGILTKVAHVLFLLIFTRVLGLEVSVETALAIIIFVYYALIAYEIFQRRQKLSRPSLSQILRSPTYSYAYWINTIVAIAYINTPQYILGSTGNMSEINYYRILIGGPLLASLIIQVYLPRITRQLHQDQQGWDHRHKRTWLLLKWTQIALTVSVAAIVAFFIFKYFGWISDNNSHWLKILMIIVFSINGAGSLITSSLGSYHQPTRLILVEVSLKVSATIYIVFSGNIYEALFISQALGATWTAYVLAGFKFQTV